MNDYIWGFGDIELDDADAVMLFGPYVDIIKITYDENGKEVEHPRRMPAALAVEEALRSPVNGLIVKKCRVIGASGFDMSMSAPYWNPWNAP